MTTYRFHYRPPLEGTLKKGRLFIRVIHSRRYKDIPCEYALYPEEWDPQNKILKIPDTERRPEVRKIEARMKKDIERLESVLETLKIKGVYSIQDICREFSISSRGNTLLSYSSILERELRDNHQYRTARAYGSASKSISAFTGKDLELSEINSVLIRSYERHLLDRGLKMNTVSFYMRNLRAIYYRAVKSGIVVPNPVSPFGKVFTGVFQTRRRALDQKEIENLTAVGEDLDKILSQCPNPQNTVAPVLDGKQTRAKRLKESLMYFMFAFHSRGMSFVDLANLKKTEISGKTILYKRKKTGFFMEVKITAPMKRIINYFSRQTKDSVYVFPIISGRSPGTRVRYETGLNRQNRNLKELASLAGIGKTMSTHVARHTWATLAKRMGYSIPLISEGLGHRDIKVTATYLDSFERSALDELSTRISKSVIAA